MTTWIGTVGGMRPTPCLSALSVVTDDLSLPGGGAGTLAPRRRLVLTTGGPRTLRASVDVARFHDIASLESLVRYQHRGGGPLRVIPCAASASNMLSRGASEEFDGWSGTFTLGQGSQAVEPETVHQRFINPGTVLDESLILDESTELRGRHWDTRSVVVNRNAWPASVASAAVGQTLTSPLVPLLDVAPWRVHLGVFVASAADVTVTAQALSSAGSVVASQSMTVNSAGLRRHVMSWDLGEAGAAAVRMLVSPSSSSATLAWPSISLGRDPHRHVLGRGIESAWLTPPSENLRYAVPGREFSGYTYDIEELV